MADKVEAYCVKHKGKAYMKNPTLHRMEGRGRLGYAAKGNCPNDDTGMFKILSQDQYEKLKSAGLKEGATIKKKDKKSKSRSKSKGGRSSGGRRKRSRSRSCSKGRK